MALTILSALSALNAPLICCHIVFQPFEGLRDFLSQLVYWSESLYRPPPTGWFSRLCGSPEPIKSGPYWGLLLAALSSSIHDHV